MPWVTRSPSFIPCLRLDDPGQTLPSAELEAELLSHGKTWRSHYERDLVLHAVKAIAWFKANNSSLLLADEQAILRYLDHLAEYEGRSYQYLRRHLTAINSFKFTNGSPYHKTGVTGAFLRYHARQHVVRRLTPLSPEDMQEILRVIAGNEPPIVAKRDAAILAFGASSALRPSALVDIDLEHVHIDKDGITLLIPRSKTDPLGDKPRYHQVARHDDPVFCPVRAVEDWIEAASLTSGPLFRPFTPHRALKTNRMHRQTYNRLVQKYTKLLGLKGDYGGYSTRRGWATYAQRCLPIARIRDFLHQKSIAVTYQYLEPIPLPWHMVPNTQEFLC